MESVACHCFLVGAVANAKIEGSVLVVTERLKVLVESGKRWMEDNAVKRMKRGKKNKELSLEK